MTCRSGTVAVLNCGIHELRLRPRSLQPLIHSSHLLSLPPGSIRLACNKFKTVAEEVLLFIIRAHLIPHRTVTADAAEAIPLHSQRLASPARTQRMNQHRSPPQPRLNLGLRELLALFTPPAELPCIAQHSAVTMVLVAHPIDGTGNSKLW